MMLVKQVNAVDLEPLQHLSNDCSNVFGTAVHARASLPGFESMSKPNLVAITTYWRNGACFTQEFFV